MRKTPLSAFVDKDAPGDRAGKRRQARKAQKLSGNPTSAIAAKQRHRAERRSDQRKAGPS